MTNANGQYRALFRPGSIGALELKNRIVKAPQSTGLGAMDGTVSERSVRHYRRLARGGAGLVLVEYTYVDDDASKSAHCQLGLSRTEHIPGLAWLVENMHEAGTRAGIQLEHCGRQKFLGTPPLKAASAKPWPLLYEQTGLIPEVLDVGGIKAIVESFGRAAQRAWMAGFDLIEIHGAHGYLITNFLSSHTNDRTDEYGGSLQNRMRFALEVVAAVRGAVPPDLPVTMRLSGSDYEPDGITIDETVEVARALESAGIDAIHVSGGDHHTMEYQVSPMAVPRGPNVWAAEAVKNAVAIPVIASGSITLPDFAEEILSAGKADFVSLGRPLLADPEWPKKAQSGRAEDIRPCIRCNDGCLDRTFMKFRSVRCSVNPTLGREGELDLRPSPRPRRVVVVGGGPAGLEAARVAATRGHDVALYEENELGGRLHEATAGSFKGDLLPLMRWQIRQLEKHDVWLVSSRATLSDLTDGDFDVAIVATGAKPRAHPDGGDDSRLAVDVLRDASDLTERANRVIVVGGGMTGVETALHLGAAGCSVILVEKGDELLFGDVFTDRITYGRMVHDQKAVEVLLGICVEQVGRHSVIGRVASGEERQLEADAVVLATGFVADGTLAESLRSQWSGEVHVVGDAVAPRKVHDAIHEGYLAAAAI